MRQFRKNMPRKEAPEQGSLNITGTDFSQLDNQTDQFSLPSQATKKTKNTNASSSTSDWDKPFSMRPQDHANIITRAYSNLKQWWTSN